MEPTLGPYQLMEQLGEGGAGVVYRARDVRKGEEVAIKLLLRPTAQRMGRFQLEAASLAKLQHPNVVPVRDYGVSREGRPYLVLELIRGQTLQRHLDTRGPLAAAEAVEVALQLAAALSSAHAQEVLHRDVKPENVLLRASDGAAILGDFGLAKDLGSQLERLTQSGSIMGTPGYLAPEQLGPSQDHSPALDVYGLGATLYAMLTGGPPATGATALEAFQATLSQAPTPPSQFASVPPALEALCLRCLAKDPAERYPNARALLDALEALDSDRPASSGRRLAPVLLVLLISLGGVVGWYASGKDTSTMSGAASPSPSDLAPTSSDPPELQTPSPSESPARTPWTGSAIKDLLDRCGRALTRHDPGAAELVQEVARVADDQPRTHVYLGVLLLRQRKSAQALTHIDRAIKLDPSLASAYSLRAQLLIGRGDLKRAKEDVQRALRADSKSDTAWASLGKIRAQEGDFKGALAAFNEAIKIFPGPLHYSDRAALFVGLGKLRLARPDADRAVRLGPHLAQPWTVRADLKRELSDPTSLEDYDRALKIDPDHRAALAGRATALLDRARYDDAIRDTTRSLSLTPDPASPQALLARLSRSVAHLYRGDHRDALRDLQELQRAKPGQAGPAFWRAEAHFRLGEFADSVEWSQAALEGRKVALADPLVPRSEIPGLSRILVKLARAQHLLGDASGSLQSLEASIQSALPRDSYPQLWATALTGDLQFVKAWTDPDPWPRPIREHFLGSLSQAQLLKIATAKSPRATCQVRTFLGVQAERRGEHSQARAHYRAAVETGLPHLDEYAWSELRLR